MIMINDSKLCVERTEFISATLSVDPFDLQKKKNSYHN